MWWWSFGSMNWTKSSLVLLIFYILLAVHKLMMKILWGLQYPRFTCCHRNVGNHNYTHRWVSKYEQLLRFKPIYYIGCGHGIATDRITELRLRKNRKLLDFLVYISVLWYASVKVEQPSYLFLLPPSSLPAVACLCIKYK